MIQVENVYSRIYIDGQYLDIAAEWSVIGKAIYEKMKEQGMDKDRIRQFFMHSLANAIFNEEIGKPENVIWNNPLTKEEMQRYWD